VFEDFSVSGLIAGFVFGVIGLWMFKEGKRRVNYTVVFISIALMIYPYFVPGAWLTWIVGGGLCGLAYYYW
jgi:multisubunit Na+/H+ antiporter MnhE subunit